MTTFAEVGARYVAQLSRGLSLTGERAAYFAQKRIARIGELSALCGLRPKVVLDFGCGAGVAFAPLRAAFGDAHIIGFEPEPNLRAVALEAAVASNVEILGADHLDPRGDADIVYCNGVFHHIPIADREDAMGRLRASLTRNGLAFIWENSPFNPGTRWVMSRIPFDRNAHLLTPRALRKLQHESGLAHVGTEYHFVFPRALGFMRPMETMLRPLPFGGQYLVVGRA